MVEAATRIVDALLYGAGQGRRFTQDGPVQSDVWVAFLEAALARTAQHRVDVLVQPWNDVPTFEVGAALHASDALGGGAAGLTWNRTVVVARLRLADLVHQVLPLTGWYAAIVAAQAKDRTPRLEFPQEFQLWDDLDLRDDLATRPAYRYPHLLGVIRLAGILQACPDKIALWDAVKALRADAKGPRRAAQAFLAAQVLAGWPEDSRTLPGRGRTLIFAVSRNRPAQLALKHSVRTVKADAAIRLFDIDCSALTWAVIDSGIDRDHPAFQIPGGSRVVSTWDFSHLRAVLTAATAKSLPPPVQARLSARATTEDTAPRPSQTTLINRIRQGRQIDWEDLKPFLQVDEGTGYEPPSDPHGTHVAGILAGDGVTEAGETIRGICPGLRLIDLRICHEDGSSDEFTLMSALQFLRHLNANADRMAVHGVNMSLSLAHDVAVYACGQTPICDEANRTVASGIVVVAAAGNLGYRRLMGEDSGTVEQYAPVSITDPGNAETVITVGATHRREPHSYGVSYFSSRGPTGDGRVKPDLVAPGEKIVSAVPGGGTLAMDGTSMAAPHVSGAAALLMARHAELIGDPARIKAVLLASATDLGREPYFQGRGLVDVLRAVQSV